MISAGAPPPKPSGSEDRLASWCGWVLVLGAVLTPLLAYLGPMGFAPVVAVLGLLMLPAVRVRREDLPLAVVLAAGLAWAAVSCLWSPYPKASQNLVKLVFELPLYWACWCGARRADPARAQLAWRILAWGLAALCLLLLCEAVIGGEIYRRIHVAFYEPIRPDLARKNLAQSAFVLALLWPLAAVGGARAGASPWLAVPMGLGLLAAAHVLLADAPVLSVGLALALAWCAWTWPSWTPRITGALMGLLFPLAPGLLLALRATGDFAALQAAAPISWGQRMGYWSHAVDLIGLHPLRGWGLDASRTFAPAIQLHPHDGALQLWLELGLVGSILGGAFWVLSVRRLVRPASDFAAAAALASAGVYFLFGALNFGIWQEWWLALGAWAAALAAAAARQPRAKFEGRFDA